MLRKDTDSAWPLSRIIRDKKKVAFMSMEGHICDFLSIAMKQTALEGSYLMAPALQGRHE
jgi:hypothetical protein